MSGIGRELHGWMTDLFPIARSLTGPGVRETLAYLQRIIPDLSVQSVPSGTEAFDWVVPDEWTLRAAYIETSTGERIVDVSRHTLHVVGYSTPVDRIMTLAELQPHLHSLPEQPEAIPYVTSYYSPRWGFCLPDRQRQSLPDGVYRVVIDSTLAPGVMNYGELLLPGETEQEVLLSTYICHPAMANNELSGPVVTAAVGRWLQQLPNRRLSYRLLFLPETLGAITYLSRHLETLRRNVVAGFIMTCLGDERAWSFLPSPRGNTLADRVALHVLNRRVGLFHRYSFLDRGSDERQYCSPGVDLPVVSIMRSKYGTYPEYHTSLDDLSLVTPTGLDQSFALFQSCLMTLEANRRYRARHKCEPQLGRRGLYPTLSQRGSAGSVRTMMNLLAYADGEQDLIAIADQIGADALDCAEIARRLVAACVLDEVA
jgi:aminopeptidase-like protein